MGSLENKKKLKEQFDNSVLTYIKTITVQTKELPNVQPITRKYLQTEDGENKILEKCFKKALHLFVYDNLPLDQDKDIYHKVNSVVDDIYDNKKTKLSDIYEKDTWSNLNNNSWKRLPSIPSNIKGGKKSKQNRKTKSKKKQNRKTKKNQKRSNKRRLK